MTLFGNRKDATPADVDVTTDQARIAQAVVIIDDSLRHGRGDAYRLYQALLEVRHAVAPSAKPLVPVIPGGA